MTQSEFPGGHWLTHSDTVETGEQIKEGATGISHTRKRAANENRTPALAASPPEAPGSGGGKNAAFGAGLWGPVCLHTDKNLASSCTMLAKNSEAWSQPRTGLGCSPGICTGSHVLLRPSHVKNYSPTPRERVPP